MSQVTTRIGLKHRVTVNRDANAGHTDAGGQPLPPDWEPHLTDLPCRACGTQANAAKEPADAAKTFVVEDRRIIVEIGTDVTEADQLGDVTDRGAVRFAGPMNIMAVLSYTDHLELIVEDVR